MRLGKSRLETGPRDPRSRKQYPTKGRNRKKKGETMNLTARAHLSALVPFPHLPSQASPMRSALTELSLNADCSLALRPPLRA